MTKADRDRRLREIAVELKRIREIPIRDLAPTDRHDAHGDAPSNTDALHCLIMARNFLRDIK